MSKTLALLALLLLTSCHTWITHPVDPETRGYDHRAKTHTTHAFLGQANQICLQGKSPTAPVDIFVIPKHPGIVKIVINEQLRFDLKGDTAQLTLQKVTPGQYHADIYLDDEFQVTLSWSIYDCGPKEQSELYKADGSGLKDYCNCEDKPCTTQP